MLLYYTHKANAAGSPQWLRKCHQALVHPYAVDVSAVAGAVNIVKSSPNEGNHASHLRVNQGRESRAQAQGISATTSVNC